MLYYGLQNIHTKTKHKFAIQFKVIDWENF